MTSRRSTWWTCSQRRARRSTTIARRHAVDSLAAARTRPDGSSSGTALLSPVASILSRVGVKSPFRHARPLRVWASWSYAPRMRRSPSPLVALGVAVTELVLVAAAGNQWIVKHLVENERANELPRDHQLKAVLPDFSWRFTPVSDERAIWLGGILAAPGMGGPGFPVVLPVAGGVSR